MSVSGLLGGHSGGDIHLGRANANKIVARFIWECSQKWDIEVSSFKGGNLRNAIPREAESVFGVHNDHREKVEEFLGCIQKTSKTNIRVWEPCVELKIESVERPEYCIDSATSLSLIRALYSAPHGVVSMSRDLENLGGDIHQPCSRQDGG